jgi:hypothetical protein
MLTKPYSELQPFFEASDPLSHLPFTLVMILNFSEHRVGKHVTERWSRKGPRKMIFVVEEK